jgi:hypothetical protein
MTFIRTIKTDDAGEVERDPDTGAVEIEDDGWRAGRAPETAPMLVRRARGRSHCSRLEDGDIRVAVAHRLPIEIQRLLRHVQDPMQRRARLGTVGLDDLDWMTAYGRPGSERRSRGGARVNP